MKKITEYELLSKKHIKWDDLFESEKELIKCMYKCDVTSGNPFKMCKGYIYIKSFREFYIKNGYLTEKQLTQLKRLAVAMYKHINNIY